MLVSLASKDRITLQRAVQGVEIPDGLDAELPVGTQVLIVHELGGAFTVRTEIGAMYRIDGSDADALGREKKSGADLKSLTAGMSGEVTEADIEKVLRTCYDPEIPVDVLELGLIYECLTKPLESGSHEVVVKMTLTAPGCGMAEWLVSDVKKKLSAIPGVESVQVDLVFDPPWEPSMMSELARFKAGLM